MNLAQKWADICVWQHSSYVPDSSQEILNFNKSDYEPLGENLWRGWFSYEYTNYEAAANRSISAWYDEKADYNYPTKTCATGKVCGHYTQVRHGWLKNFALS